MDGEKILRLMMTLYAFVCVLFMRKIYVLLGVCDFAVTIIVFVVVHLRYPVSIYL